MIRFEMKSGLRLALMAGLLAMGAAAEARKKQPPLPPPPPPPPPAPKVVYVPPKPTPPDYASPTMAIPGIGSDGLRVSVNRNITQTQAAWNLRSAYNVAALNCHEPRHAEIVVSYRAFLKANAKTLSLVNRKVDAEWRAKYGARFIAPREKYMTEVYNHFATPPTLPAFCDAVMAVSRDAKKVKPVGLAAFAAASLPSIEIVFDDFYKRYDQYRLDLADWQTKYGNLVATSVVAQAQPLQPTAK